jgi:ABC-type glycerol-3-phosphate transport system permease component
MTLPFIRIKKWKTWTFLVYVLLAFLATIMIYPYLWMFLASFAPDSHIFKSILPSPSSFNLRAYRDVFLSETLNISLYTKNSFLQSFGAVFINVITFMLAAYVLARKKIPGETFFLAFFLGAMIIPLEVLILPLFLVVNSLHLLGTNIGIILSLSSEALTFFILYNFFKQVPKEMEEAALIDGASQFDILWRIMIPLARPAVTTVILLRFLFSWSAFINPLVLSLTEKTYNLQVAMSYFNTMILIDFQAIMAFGTIITVPIVVVFVIAQRKVIEGITKGAVKG